MLLLLLAASMVTLVLSSPCNKEKCTGPYMLRTAYTPLKISDPSMVKIVTYKYNPTAKMVLIIKRERWDYCYEGSLLDPNSGCESKTGIKPVSDEEFNREGCMVTDSSTDDDWGSAAYPKCFEAKYYFVSHREGTLFNKRFKVPFANHLCVRDWECKVKVANLPISIKSTDSKVYTYSPSGNPIIIGKIDMYDKAAQKLEVTGSEDIAQYKLTYSTTNIIANGKANCFNSSRSHICVIQESEDKSIIGHTFHVEDGRDIATMGNYKITLSALTNAATTGMREKMNGGKAASIDDLKALMDDQIYMMEETHYNTLMIKDAVNKIHDTLNKVINSVAKIDDELIPNILDKKGKTTWSNERIFNICPCFDTMIKDTSNCNNGFIFLDGRVVRKTEENEHQCQIYDVSTITKLDYIRATNISVVQLAFPPPEGASMSWDGWSWVVEEKKKMVTAATFFNENTNNGVSFIESVSGIGSFLPKINMAIICSYLTIFNTLMWVFFLCFWRRQ